MDVPIAPETLAAFTTPFLFTWGCFVLLVIEHSIDIFNLKFQGLCLRIAFVFPFVGTVNYISIFISYTAFLWIDILSGIAEGFLLIEFFALMIGWIWERGGNVYEIFLKERITRTSCFCLGHSCGKEFKSGISALNRLYYQILQYLLVKPTTNLIKAIVQTASATSNISDRVLRVIDLISIIIALRALIVAYRALRRQKHEETNMRYLQGLALEAKFVLIKLLFGFIVVNNLVFLVLSADGDLSIPSFVCTEDVESNRCKQMFASFIFLVEQAFASSLLLLFYRSQARCYPDLFGNFQNYPDDSKDKRSFLHLMIKAFHILDLHNFIYRRNESDKQYGSRKSNARRISEQATQPNGEEIEKA